MNLIIYALLGLVATWLLYVIYIQLTTRATVGRPANPLFDIAPQAARPGKLLVYCFSPRCGPCRPMSAQVDKLIDAGLALVKLDVGEHPQTSRELNLKVTPTLILIEDGTVSRVFLGVRSADFMRKLLAGG